ncbi:MAG: DUF4869 domain-containing protein [Eubacterium sp.]|jgi:hypothetical protein|nr:DUF4869 domain-containing protein [Eubacterium sp.]
MLNIYFGEIPESEKSRYIYNTAVFFKNTYKDKWITAPLTVEMIKDVDKSEVVSGSQINSPIFGLMSPVQLSGGVKTLILTANDTTHIFNASTCGDNCAKWFLKMAEDKKVVINLRHLMDFGKEPFRIRVINTGKIVNNMKELILEAGSFV